MSDAYYPELDPGIMDQAPRDAARAYEADQRSERAPLVPDTRRARYAVLASHCAQARAGYFYCEATPADPCGYSAGNRHPHDQCTPAECRAPHTCDGLAAYSAAPRNAATWWRAS